MGVRISIIIIFKFKITYLVIITSRGFALSEIKVLMEYKYFSPVKLLNIYGFIGTIITIILTIVSTFIECNSSLEMKICNIKDNANKSYFFENFKIWWNDEINIGKIIILLIGILINFFYRLFYFLIIKNLTAIHIIFSNLFYTTLLEWIERIILQNISFIYFFNLIIQIIVAFGLLIYLEMIELDFCNLNYNLKQTIIDRSIKDFDDLNIFSEKESDSSNFNNNSSNIKY